MIRATIETELMLLNQEAETRALTVAEQNLRRDCEIALGKTSAKPETIREAWNRCKRAVLRNIRGER